MCLVKGVVPIYLAEAALWASLAWYWHKKGSTSKTADLIILLCAVTVAAGEGYLLGRGSNVASRTLAHAAATRHDAEAAIPANPPPNDTIDPFAELPRSYSPSYTLEKPKKSKPSPVLRYATVATYEEDIYQRCAFNTGSDPCLLVDGPENDFSGKVATLRKDDRIEILSAKVRAPNGKDIYRVRFQQWTGYVDAESLALEAQ